MKVGNTTFTEEGLSQITKLEFLNIYRGKLSEDIEVIAKRFNKYFKQDVQPIKGNSKKYKEAKNKGYIQDSFSE